MPAECYGWYWLPCLTDNQKADFSCVPLVSIDLIIRDPERKVLLGLRNHEPAKGYYFVPGGRIRKGELLEEAFLRILAAETGCRANFESARFLGVYQHMYANNRFGHPDFGTHYVVLAYELSLNRRPTVMLDSQHSVCVWMDEGDLKTRLRYTNSPKRISRAL